MSAVADGGVGAGVHEVLGERAKDVDDTILDYIVNVLKDETFEFGWKGEGAFEAVGALLVDSGCVEDEAEARTVCGKLAEKFARDVKTQGGYRKLATSVRMSDGMPETEEYRTQEPTQAPPQISERDQAKMERRRRKEERQRLADYEAHLAAAEASTAGMPAVMVNHGGVGEGSVPKDIRLENFSISLGGKELINSATVTLAYGRRYGLVGRNGTGKTTLLKHMAMHAIDGIPKNCQILHVEQEVVGDDTTVLQCVLSSDIERSALMEEEAQLAQQRDPTTINTTAGAKVNGSAPLIMKDGTDAVEQDTKPQDIDMSKAESKDPVSERLAQIYKRLEQIDAYSAEARAASILAGLSFTSEMQQRKTKTFSGGWRMRVALARALFVEPDLLLLDEPTNHLDLHAVLWLENYLLKWPKTLIVVSHAREFLNTVVTDVLHLHNQIITVYKGDYDTFERTRDERLRNQQKAHEANERTRSHIQAFVDKFRYNAKRASLVQSRIKALERIGHVDAVINDPDYKFEFPTPEDKPSAPIISFSDATFGYPGGPLLFKNLNFGIDLDSRLAMVGPNGIGKSTLLKLISGELEPISGSIFRSAKVRMAVFSQHHVDGLDLSSTPLLYMAKCFPGVMEQRLRSHLGSFGISGNLALQAMYTLSGGQKSRVAFAKITFNRPHILLLDEPSNHLDLDAVEALIGGLAMFQGGVLMVSHDEHLISGSVDELWVVSDGKATPFHGTFKEYKKTLRVT
ncbi:ATP-binding cassette, subfamily F, member 3 [Marchantia polymorpha subsp. ruderalis]|uniref:ABC transporter domain-containing protein n=2 Tax=Marchantia polymorpha TaxID=3197 RepID=A0A176WB83_MARPO|nr:hypothetical protein AXG93_4201s1400 [Marchantia polymorpha subsp. ruderalis]PTQ32149.1 hypothetical protein MARPO_0102s0020 [Marchantia polymorpha]BBN17941.1 hypothetical protein Mp_7g18200 [Marchantia polymorpha subsp. ruderalis]|eukprot:PTQ32149.1 hypothetical protein MARPO_0102s0020 [Marchantia polymorpha]